MRNLIDATKQWELTDKWMTQGDRKGRTPLHLASIYGYINVVEFIVEEVIDCGDTDEVKERYLNLRDSKGRTPMFYSAAQGRQTVLQFLIDKGADMNIGTNETHYEPGSTPLMACAEKNEIQCFDLLVKKGANLLITRDDGADATYIAARYGHLDIIEGMFERLAETDQVEVVATQASFKGRTPLLTAAFHGHSLVCRAFFVNGASLDHQDEEGYTALMYASNEGHLELVKWLITNGANMNMKNNNGENALKCAMSNKNYDIAKIIKTLCSEMDDKNDNDNMKEDKPKIGRAANLSKKGPAKRIKRS
jgi:ankyrin repeat protein